MKQVSRRAGGYAAALLAIMATSGGCTDEQTGFFVLGNVVVDAPDCVASPDPGGTMRSAGLLDVALRPDYVASFVVGSQLTPRGDKANLRTETMITMITGAEVELRKDDGSLDTDAAPGGSFTVPAEGVIQPDGSPEPGFGVVFVTLIPPAGAAALAAEINNPAEIKTRTAKVVVFGKTIGGLDVEASPFTYVVRACEGCLVQFPADAYDPTSGCLPTGEGVEPTCSPGQDEPVDCRTCTNQNSFCQFPGGVPPL